MARNEVLIKPSGDLSAEVPDGSGEEQGPNQSKRCSENAPEARFQWIPDEPRKLEHSRESRKRFYKVVGHSSIDRQHFMAKNNDRNAIPS